jgi:transcriptional regulator with XRE-family HTH domain
MAKKNGFTVWDNELEQEFFSAEEIEASNIRVALMGEIIKARKEKGISQRDLESMSGLKQPAIARMERGTSSPTLDTLIKVLVPLGKTLSIVSISKGKGRKKATKQAEEELLAVKA